MIKKSLQDNLQKALEKNQLSFAGEILIEKCKNKHHGHFATNLALILAKNEKTVPRLIAEKLVVELTDLPEVEKIEIAGAGFINFTLRQSYLNQMLKKAVNLKSNFGTGKDKKTKVILEFVSANPTGPLHIGHARGAAFGMVLANLMEKSGYQVYREYYINDFGRQMDILTLSIWLRYLALNSDDAIDLPNNAYQGGYISEISKSLAEKKLINQSKQELSSIMQDWQLEKEKYHRLDPEKQLDFLIEFVQSKLNNDWQKIKKITLNTILDDIKDDLSQFGLKYQNYFSEETLHQKNQVKAVLGSLKQSNYLYQKDGSWVFKSTEFGDRKDRVVVRSNGQLTYFGTDIAYHLDKLKRADLLINIWGADHHGYIARMKAALEASGKNPDLLEVLLVQFVRLIKDGQKISMSTRSADFISLRDLREDIGSHLNDLGKNIGNDTVRFFFVQKKLDQHMEFDWDLATSKKQDNPIIYLNYAFARIQSVLKLSKGKGIEPGEKNLDLLDLEIERDLIFQLIQYPDLIERAALSRSPHLLSFYLLELVGLFHTYYANAKFIEKDLDLSSARLYLIKAIASVINNALAIFAIKPKSRM